MNAPDLSEPASADKLSFSLTEVLGTLRLKENFVLAELVMEQ